MASILRRPIAEYLASHHVMTLATQGTDGPWAAAVLYVNDAEHLFFLSAPSSRHCRNLSQDARCSATIHEDYDDWRQIKGIQLEGQVSELQGEEQDRARRLYARKFPIVGGLAHTPLAIAQALARVHWYLLRPARLYFIDNSQGFGHREQIDLHQD
ncbi:MAG TPA: pyridoxamine 5'-phosphate oxidase family protein [Burkholderiaceae bacterium]|nr:pyridoxamine 5'-phosphate oxidase family protein [Burkholderiaceae bacterium]